MAPPRLPHETARNNAQAAHLNARKAGQVHHWDFVWERTTGFEPATPTLARLCSTN